MKKIITFYLLLAGCSHLLSGQGYVPMAEGFLLMDFSLEVGDTLQELCVLGGMSFLITNIEEGDWPPGIYFIQYLVEGVPMDAERVVVL